MSSAGGFRIGDRQPSALLLGEFVDGDLRYLGQVGSPGDSWLMRAVARMLIPRAESPFKDAICEPRAQFCEPTLRVGVEFLDFTDDGYLRRPAFRRFADELITAV